MMYWYGNGPSGWGYTLMGVGSVVSWIVMITVIVLLVRFLARANRSEPSVSPEELLARRYARGEMDDVEYRHRLETLRVGPHAQTGDGRP